MNYAIEGMLATHEALRRLGFAPADIYMTPAIRSADGAITPGIVLKTQGKQFSIYMAAPTYKPEDLPKTTDVVKLWAEAVEFWNNTETPEAERKRIFYEHMPGGSFVHLIDGLIAKGFTIPIHRGDA